jgi:hypothetical protein
MNRSSNACLSPEEISSLRKIANAALMSRIPDEHRRLFLRMQLIEPLDGALTLTRAGRLRLISDVVPGGRADPLMPQSSARDVHGRPALR